MNEVYNVTENPPPHPTHCLCLCVLVFVGHGWTWLVMVSSLAPDMGACECSVGSGWTSCWNRSCSIDSGTPPVGHDELSCASASSGDMQSGYCTVRSTIVRTQMWSVEVWPLTLVPAPSAR